VTDVAGYRHVVTVLGPMLEPTPLTVPPTSVSP